jgi:hypothetical protein
VTRRAGSETTKDFSELLNTMWTYAQLFDWPLLASVVFSSCLVSHFVCILERFETITRPTPCACCVFDDCSLTAPRAFCAQVQPQLPVETSLLCQILSGDLVVPSAAAMLLFSVFSSRLVNNECSCLGSFRGALYRAPHPPHRGRGLCK